ncbi:MAG: DUF4390 domain-containing protein [Chromatiales bacterium]
MRLRWLPVLLSFWAGSIMAGQIDIHETRVWLQGERYLLDADLAYELDDGIMEALDNGIPVVFTISLVVEEASLLSLELANDRLDYHIRFRPLTAFYEVTGPSGEQRSFVTRAALFTHLGELREVPLVDVAVLDKDASYRYRMKVELDIESLPLPMRPMAWFSPVWNLSSGWKEWPLSP